MLAITVSPCYSRILRIPAYKHTQTHIIFSYLVCFPQGYHTVNRWWWCVSSSPDEVPAVGAVGGLSQVRGHELVSVDLVDPPADGPLALPGPHTLPKHSLLILGGSCRSCKPTHKQIKTMLDTVRVKSMVVYLLLYCSRGLFKMVWTALTPRSHWVAEALQELSEASEIQR